ncbi:MAG: ferrochelatase [Acidimicrobiales bacterium]
MFDALLLVSFGGPEGPDDVMPFLHNVVRGRDVPPERLERVAAQYLELGGVSPINSLNRDLLQAIRADLARRGSPLPVYWGNRNWHPLLVDTVRDMRSDGIQRAAAFVTSAYSSYSGCRQYIEDLAAARAEVGRGAPEMVKLRPFFNHPGFVEPLADGLRGALQDVGPDAPVWMTAHSIPAAMASACDYERQLRETGRLVAERAGVAPERWSLVFQSRSGPPRQPWLGPDVHEALAGLVGGTRELVATPIGFVSDHMEVVFDLDRELATAAAARGVRLVRTPTPGTDPRFAAVAGDLIEEASRPGAERSTPGALGAAPFPCEPACCPPSAGHSDSPAGRGGKAHRAER